MTKKHFEAAAEIVREFILGADTPEDIESARIVACAYVRLFRQFSPRFDADRFFEACRLSDMAADDDGRPMRLVR